MLAIFSMCLRASCRHYDRSGNVLSGPATRTGKRARGFGQVLEDSPGSMTRTINGRTYNLADFGQNVEAGLRLFNAGGSDPVGRRLEYFGGRDDRLYYERTGQIPPGGDKYTSKKDYVSRSMPGPGRRLAPREQGDILAGGLVSGPPTPTRPATSMPWATGHEIEDFPPQGRDVNPDEAELAFPPDVPKLGSAEAPPVPYRTGTTPPIPPAPTAVLPAVEDLPIYRKALDQPGLVPVNTPPPVTPPPGVDPKVSPAYWVDRAKNGPPMTPEEEAPL